MSDGRDDTNNDDTNDDDTNDDDTNDDDTNKVLDLPFSRLDEECQQLLRLMTAEPALSYDEIAAILGRPRGSLGPARRRCLQQLRAGPPPGFER